MFSTTPKRVSRVLVCLVAAVTLAGPSVAPATAQQSQNRKQLYDQGTEALYNLDFATALNRYKQLRDMDPENPACWNHVASAMWLKIVASQEKLNMESFEGASLGTDSSGETVGREDEQDLRDAVKTAIAKADAILNKKDSKNDLNALYAKGVAKGTMAAFEAVAKKSYKAALDNASSAKELHQKVLDLDKNKDFTDAKLSIGLYKYAVGSIPNWVRFFLLLWSGGDKVGGIEDVVAVANGKGAAATDAKMLLVVMYNREHQFEKSYETLTALHKLYPRNYMLEMSGAAVQAKLDHREKSVEIYKGVMEKVDARRDGYERLEAPKVLLLMARTYVDLQKIADARTVWQRVIDDKRSTDNDRANAHLWLGKSYDAEARNVPAQREKAKAEYNAILRPELKAAPRLKEEAKKYLKTPWG